MLEYFKGAKGSWIWLVIRLYVGYQWMTAGWHKLVDGFDASGFLKGAIAKAVPASEGRSPWCRVGGPLSWRSSLCPTSASSTSWFPWASSSWAWR
jgi:hypothetical protein